MSIVLNAAAAKGDWGKPLPPGRHRGIAQFMGYGSYTAAIAEVSVKGRDVRVHRLILATNCGHAVNPVQVASQIEGSVAYGMSATLHGECTVENGRMKELNFDTYPILRLAEMPKVETVIVPSGGHEPHQHEPRMVADAILRRVTAGAGRR